MISNVVLVPSTAKVKKTKLDQNRNPHQQIKNQTHKTTYLLLITIVFLWPEILFHSSKTNCWNEQSKPALTRSLSVATKSHHHASASQHRLVGLLSLSQTGGFASSLQPTDSATGSYPLILLVGFTLAASAPVEVLQQSWLNRHKSLEMEMKGRRVEESPWMLKMGI